jgi:hypothetical protein
MVHTDPTAPLVLRRRKVDKSAMKKIGINCFWWSELFLIFIFNFSMGKAKMNALHFCKLPKHCLTGNGHAATVLRLFKMKEDKIC